MKEHTASEPKAVNFQRQAMPVGQTNVKQGFKAIRKIRKEKTTQKQNQKQKKNIN